MLQSDLLSVLAIGRDPGVACRHNDGESQSICDSTQGHKDGAESPSPSDVPGFVALREEKIEEESGTKYRGHRNTTEDVV